MKYMAGMIVRQSEVCLNNRFKKMDCRRCGQICPQGCMDAMQQPELTQCDECGLCLAACPAQALAGVSYSPQSFEALLALEDAVLCLTCTQQDKQSNWPCLGFLDARLLLTLVYSGKHSNRQIIVDNRGCADCKPAVARHLQQLCDTVAPVLAFAGKKPLLHGPAAAGYQRREKAISRRALASWLWGEAKSVIAVAVTSSEEPLPLPRRKLLANYVGALAGMEEPTRLFSGLVIAGNCHACGLCRQICPEQAIVTKDRGNTVDFYHQALACTGCGVCAVHCPRGAITLGPAAGLTLSHIASRTLPECQDCGKVYQPVGDNALCLVCSLKNNGNIFG